MAHILFIGREPMLQDHIQAFTLFPYAVSGSTEIEEFYSSVLRDGDIVGRNISVNDAFCMDHREGIHNR